MKYYPLKSVCLYQGTTNSGLDDPSERFATDEKNIVKLNAPSNVELHTSTVNHVGLSNLSVIVFLLTSFRTSISTL